MCFQAYLGFFFHFYIKDLDQQTKVPARKAALHLAQQESLILEL